MTLAYKPKSKISVVQFNKLRVRRVLQKRIRRITEYKPHNGGQDEFHQAIDFGITHLMRYCGRRYGKTISEADEQTQQLAYKPERSLPIRHTWITGPEYDLCDPIFEYVWHWVVDKKCLGYKPKSQSVKERYIQMPWNARCSCLTTKNPDSLQGKGVMYVSNDEFADHDPDILENYLEPVVSDTHGVISNITTPDGKLNHSYPVWEEWSKYALDPNELYFVQHKTSYDNPYNSKEYLDQLKEKYRALGKIELFNQEFLAQIISISGALYPMFSPSLLDGVVPWHVQDIEPIRGVPFVGFIDWGFTHPFAFLLAQLIDDDVIRIYDEIYESGLTDPDKLVQVYRMVKPELADYLYCDPSNPGAKQLFKEAGYNIFEPDNTKSKAQINSVNQGVIEVRSLFSREDKPGIVINRDKCSHLIKEIPSYKTDPKSKVEKPLKVDDHAVDALRYGVMGTIGLHISEPEFFDLFQGAISEDGFD